MNRKELQSLLIELKLPLSLIEKQTKISLIPDNYIVELIKDNIDLSIKSNNIRLPENIKLLLRKDAHKGTWYSDDYTPYCMQSQFTCTSPRMLLKSYGYVCPYCRNEISFTGNRLIESPLNNREKQ